VHVISFFGDLLGVADEPNKKRTQLLTIRFLNKIYLQINELKRVLSSFLPSEMPAVFKLIS
jgi:hypothetical protein